MWTTLSRHYDKYEVTQDWSDILYCGITLMLNYKAQLIDISMPRYVTDESHKFQPPTPMVVQYQPHQWNKSTYCAATQCAYLEDDLVILPLKGITTVRKIVGNFLYYALAVEFTMLVALGYLA